MIISIVIPALNEEKTIGAVIDSIPHAIDKVSKIKIIVVDDGSNDKTAEIAEKKGAIVVSHIHNQGVGKAFQSGVEKALGEGTDIMVNIDADGQFEPQEIQKIIQPILEKKADLVTGSRFIDKAYIPKNMPLLKRWGNRRVANIISWATKQRFYDVSCGFRAYSREALLQMNLFGKFTYTQETFLDLAYKGLQIVEVPVTVKYFDDRESRVAGSVIRYALKAGNIMFRTIKDYQPLQFFGYCGLITFLLGLSLDLWVFNHFLNTGSFSPYKIFGFLGAFLNAIGIMIAFIGILADLIDRLRMTEEKLLYYQKKAYYKDLKK